MREKIKFTLNGKSIELETDTSQVLLWVLRAELGLTGTKFGCGVGFCGACTILVDGVAQRSCGMAVKEIEGKAVVTIEGLAEGDKLHPVQKAFIEHEALQCGFCTSGQIMNAVALLKEDPKPNRKRIIEGMNGNLCRCGAYNRIIAAVETASKEMNGGTKL
ncbi:MAG: (2Fe-2S)-binding protein [Prolixibacteraceae bacterium]|nr:(2Fe-2S)-binding protein [Prolixibacteraceae bacterium]